MRGTDDDGLIERAARREDAVALAALMNIAGDGIPMEVWRAMAGEGESALDVGVRRAARDEGAFSYANAWVAVIDGTIAGMAFGYRLAEEPDTAPPPAWLPRSVLPFIALEGEVPGSFYLNGIAVLPEARGRGIGRRLIEEGLRRARASGAGLYSLTMFRNNHPAAALYAAMGFRAVAARPPLEEPHHAHRGEIVLMTRPL